MLIHSSRELGILIKNQRLKNKLSQSEVGDLVGLQQKTISAIENNSTQVKLTTVFRVLAALELDLHISPRAGDDHKKSKWSEEW